MLYKNLPEKDLKHVMHARFWLDYIAAAKFLLTGHYPNACAVYEAWKAFHAKNRVFTNRSAVRISPNKNFPAFRAAKRKPDLSAHLQGKKRFTETMNRENLQANGQSTGQNGQFDI